MQDSTVPKSSVQSKLDELQEDAKKTADNAPLIEEEVELSDDIDSSRLEDIARDLAENSVPKTAVLPHTPSPKKESGTMTMTVLSVTDIPFVPAKSKGSENAPTPSQKYHILIETFRPLQGGKEYKVIL